jgi:hypothetical protein
MRDTSQPIARLTGGEVDGGASSQDARTGTYTKTLTFALSTTTP